MNESQVNRQGVGFAGLLTLIFITLKLMGEIDWSWWWVLAPLWISFILFLVIIAVVLVLIKQAE